MSDSQFVTRTPVAKCGCGGDGIVWVRPSDWGSRGTVEAFCSKHCGIGVSPHVYVPETFRKIGLKVVHIWNRALS